MVSQRKTELDAIRELLNDGKRIHESKIAVRVVAK